MDPDEIRFMRQKIKSEARRFFFKSARPPCFKSPLKLQRHLIELLAIWKQIANAGMNIHHAVGIGGIFVYVLF